MINVCFPYDMFAWPSTPPLAKVVSLKKSFMELYSIQGSLPWSIFSFQFLDIVHNVLKIPFMQTHAEYVEVMGNT